MEKKTEASKDTFLAAWGEQFWDYLATRKFIEAKNAFINAISISDVCSLRKSVELMKSLSKDGLSYSTVLTRIFHHISTATTNKPASTALSGKNDRHIVHYAPGSFFSSGLVSTGFFVVSLRNMMKYSG
jgi:hypothetical protein